MWPRARRSCCSALRAAARRRSCGSSPGLKQPDAGRVILHGKDVTDLPARERGVGVIFQILRALPAHDASSRTSATACASAAGRARRSRRRSIACSRSCSSKSTARNTLRSSPADSSSAWRSRARSPTSRKCCSSTSRSARSTRRRASHLRREIRALLQAGQRARRSSSRTIRKKRSSLGDRIAVLNAGQLEQIGHARRCLQPARDRVCGHLFRRGQSPARRDSGDGKSKSARRRFPSATT